MEFNGKYQSIRVLNNEGSYGTLFEVEEKSEEKNHFAELDLHQAVLRH